MEKVIKSKITWVVVILIIAALLFLYAGRREEDFSVKYVGYDLSGVITGRANTYTRYLERYADIPDALYNIPVNLFAWSSGYGVSILENFENEQRVLRTEERSYIEYNINVTTAGFYFIHIEYFPVPSRGIPIERSLKLNGQTPFLGADRLSFQRVWGDAGNSRFDNQGNEIRPAQIERPRWENAWFRDSLGFVTEPYGFYFHEGTNVLRLEGMNEPLVLRSLELRAPVHALYYEDYIATLDLAPYKRNPNANHLIKVQGERAVRRSDPSLYAIYDRSSGATEPPSVARIRLNMIGGQSWRVAGQWIEWEFEVPEDGMYRFTVKGRQNYNRGFVSNRAIFINGEMLCRELSAIPFTYSNRWRHVSFRDRDDDDYMYFPLRRGRHTIRMQVTMGALGEMLTVMEESVFRLNTIFRRILVLTGPEPDVFRDYRVDVVYPEVIEAMALESKILYKLVDDLTAYAGERNAQAAVALTLARQLEFFVRRPDRIPRTLNNFKNNISALGDSLLALSQSQLDIDYIIISTENAKIPRIRENFFVAASHEIRSFLASFFVDYNNLGDVHRGGDVVQVWMLAGRDQSTILKSMIDDTFTPLTGIRVNVKLVAPDAVMPAVVAGTGPDMALTIGQGDVINYAIRGAVVDISQFPGYEDVIKQLHPSVIVPFEFQGGVFGLPETQYFHVMFYRRDIFEELEIDLPNTWDDLINILPIIQKNNMNVGIPSVANSAMPDFSNFLAHLFQRGGRLYNEDGSRTLLDSEIAIEAFDFYTKFFTHYKTPMVFDFVNRFRTGEMPLGFADYTNFNTLEVFAPELRGLWGFALMPGLEQPDGTIDRSIPTGTLASMIFSNSRRPDLAWEFMKWWISADTQLRFGRELESIMGAAARYPTANYEAFLRLSWGSDQMAILDAQRAWTVGTPEVPGGYFVSRHITNAVRRILNEGMDTRETLLDYTITINDELLKKRREFGLE
jgi:ABC-type glycerol-3-phosphate transport system substrate-binding protein